MVWVPDSTDLIGICEILIFKTLETSDTIRPTNQKSLSYETANDHSNNYEPDYLRDELLYRQNNPNLQQLNS